MTAGRWSFLRPTAEDQAEPSASESLGPRLTPSLGTDWRVRTGVVGTDKVTDLRTWGLRTAGEASASPEVLKAVIGWIYRNKITVDDAAAVEERDRLNDLNHKVVEKEGELQNARHRKTELESSIATEREKAGVKRAELAAVRAGDGKYVEAQGLSDTLSFFIAGVILAFLTLYLFLFYVSAIYNAFIFDAAKAAEEGMQTGRELSVTIFNGLAFQKAWASGLFTFAFIGSAPSIVLGLGFLIHHFSRIKKRLYIVAIFTVTFLFDLLLAYEIVYQIYRIKVLTGESTAEWSASVLLHSAEFYIILLAGFVVYIIWGLILQVVLEGVEKFRPARVAARTLSHAIAAIEETLARLETELKTAAREVVNLEGQLRVLEQQRSPRELRNNAFYRHIEELMQGWLTYIAQAFPDERAHREAEAHRVREETVALLIKDGAAR